MSKLSWANIECTAKILDLEPCLLAAVCKVEAKGDGFLKNGRPKILFEPHVFWAELVQRYYRPEGLLAREDVRRIHGDISDILYKKWGERPYGTQIEQWSRLARAKAINEIAALCSTSWGAFQIMGFNYKICGYKSVQEFVQDMSNGYTGQLQALIKFLNAKNLVEPLKNHDWARFAYGYNGSGFARHQYDVQLRQAYEECVGAQ